LFHINIYYFYQYYYHINNLYFVNNEFIYLSSTKNIELKEVNIRTDLREDTKFKPKIVKVLDSNTFIKNNNVEIIEENTLYATHDYHHNIVHALYDVLYPLYLIFLNFNILNENKEFNIFLNLITNQLKPFKGNCSREYNLEVFKKFSKGKLFLNSTIKKNYCFKNLICGIGLAGVSSINKKGIMPGKDLYVLEKFRNRMMNCYNIVYPKKSNKIILGIIKGGRFSNEDYTILNKIQSKYNNDNIECKFIDYYNIQSFEEQLKLISKIHIHISHPGTSMFNFIFLNNNSIHINTGCIFNGFPSLLESNICALSNNISVKYYDIHKYKKILYEPLNYIINESINDINNKLVLKNEIPLFIKIWQELCEKDVKTIEFINNYNKGIKTYKRGSLCSKFCDGIIYEYKGFTMNDNLINNIILGEIKIIINV